MPAPLRLANGLAVATAVAVAAWLAVAFSGAAVLVGSVAAGVVAGGVVLKHVVVDGRTASEALARLAMSCACSQSADETARVAGVPRRPELIEDDEGMLWRYDAELQELRPFVEIVVDNSRPAADGAAAPTSELDPTSVKEKVQVDSAFDETERCEKSGDPAV